MDGLGWSDARRLELEREKVRLSPACFGNRYADLCEVRSVEAMRDARSPLAVVRSLDAGERVATDVGDPGPSVDDRPGRPIHGWLPGVYAYGPWRVRWRVVRRGPIAPGASSPSTRCAEARSWLATEGEPDSYGAVRWPSEAPDHVARVPARVLV